MKTALKQFSICCTAAITLISCATYSQLLFVAPNGSRIKLIKNTSQVQKLLRDRRSADVGHDLSSEKFLGKKQSASDFADTLRLFAQMNANPDKYTNDRKSFLLIMNKQPAIVIPAGSRASLISHSDTKCANLTFDAPSYIEVRIESPPLKGEEGWVCDGEFKPPIAWP